MTMLEKITTAMLVRCTELTALDRTDRPDFYRELARTALEAMREPTDGMYDAYRCDEMWRDMNSRQVWRLWIDSALAEVEQPPSIGVTLSPPTQPE